MMTLSEEEYYIVSVKLREVKALDGHILTHEGDIGWLEVDQGYPQITMRKKSAYQFIEPPKKEAIAKWDGMPWYNRIIPDSETVYKVKEIITHSYEEVVV